jgi:hypothetical protein
MGQAQVIQFTARLESIECVECGVTFAMPADMLDSLRKNGKRNFYCPSGHSMSYGGGEVERLKQQLAQKDAELQRKQNAVNLAETMRGYAERSLSAQRGINTKLMKRVGNGTCPCCKRTFKQLAQHMAHKHPGYGKPDEEA